jgi:hypothetical protein
MTTQLDGQLGLKKESTFGTGVTPDEFYEFNTELFDADLTYAQGNGLRVGQRMNYGDRRVLVKTEVTGSFEMDLLSKNNGKAIEAAFGGTGTSNVVTGSAYQQNFTPTTTDSLSSYTIQKGAPPVGGGSVLAQTFVGCVCTGFTITGGNSTIPTISFDWVGKDLVTATGLATAAYHTNVFPMSFAGGAIGLGGTLTVPTTTAIGTGPTATVNVTEFSLTYSNGIDAAGFNFGGNGKLSRKPVLGRRTATGSLTIEYADNTLRDLWLAGTSLPLLITYTSTVAITGAVYPQFSIAIPAIKLNGALPMVTNSAEPITISIDFEVVDDRTAAHPIYVSIVTAETSI